MQLTQWLKNRRIRKLNCELAKTKAALAVYQSAFARMAESNTYFLGILADHEARIAEIKYTLRTLGVEPCQP